MLAGREARDLPHQSYALQVMCPAAYVVLGKVHSPRASTEGETVKPLLGTLYLETPGKVNWSCLDGT